MTPHPQASDFPQMPSPGQRCWGPGMGQGGILGREGSPEPAPRPATHLLGVLAQLHERGVALCLKQEIVWVVAELFGQTTALADI